MLSIAWQSDTSGGCDFPRQQRTDINQVARLRGFFNVTDDLAGQEILLGLYDDDAVSLKFYDKNRVEYPIRIQSCIPGAPTYRHARAVCFEEPGIYPIEILHSQLLAHSALELSYRVGLHPSFDFSDFEQIASEDQGNQQSLRDAGFTLVPETMFFQTISGEPSFGDLAQCQQCVRGSFNSPNNGCENLNNGNQGYYCNEAALCAECNTALVCGPTCSPCGGTTPFCINVNEQYQCSECRDDNDCRSGTTCVEGECVECNTDDTCAGNSCKLLSGRDDVHGAGRGRYAGLRGVYERCRLSRTDLRYFSGPLRRRDLRQSGARLLWAQLFGMPG